MAQLIFGHDEALAQWAERQYPEGAPFARPMVCMGVADNSGQKLHGVIMYSGRSETTIDFAIVSVSPRWATKGTVRAMLYYPFFQLGLLRMSALTLKRNKRARAGLEKVGFKHEGTHPFAFPTGETAVTYGLYKDDAIRKWFNGEYRAQASETA